MTDTFALTLRVRITAGGKNFADVVKALRKLSARFDAASKIWTVDLDTAAMRVERKYAADFDAADYVLKSLGRKRVEVLAASDAKADYWASA